MNFQEARYLGFPENAIIGLDSNPDHLLNGEIDLIGHENIGNVTVSL